MCFHNSCRTEFFCAFSIIGSGGGGGIPVQYQVPHSSGDGLRPSQSAGMMQPSWLCPVQPGTSVLVFLG